MMQHGWTGIGSSEYDYDTNIYFNKKVFQGTFNGKNCIIEGVYINTYDRDIVGLFAYNEGTIKNVNLKNSIVQARYIVGGIAGANEGTIENCNNYASVSGARFIGGICSWSNGILDSDINYGQISSALETGWHLEQEGIGGIAGWGANTITKCGNYGNIISTTLETSKVGTNGIGGIIGNVVETSNVSNCYNLGTITSNAINGAGIIGVVYNSEEQKVTISSAIMREILI